MTVTINWDLDTIFTGGSESPDLAAFLNRLTSSLNDLDLTELPTGLTDETSASWVEYIRSLYLAGAQLGEAGSYANCLVSQDVNDEKAFQLQARIDQLGMRLATLWTRFAAAAAHQDEAAWSGLMSDPALSGVTFHLGEERDLARLKMPLEMETLAHELAADGYHAWDRLYGLISGVKQVTFDGELMSLGQLQNLYIDSPDRQVRQRAFELFEESWTDLARSCALALNNQAGFRLTLYRHRRWDSVLVEPLLKNRLRRETLETMWGVVDTKSAKLLEYFQAKAKLLGVDRLSWYDVMAPVGEINRSISYPKAADFVVETIQSFDPDIADFCRMAVDSRWVEAENRAGKRAGAYCTSFPLAKQSRVFMTYSGSYNGLLTLAHELGHGYHSWVMRDLPYGARRYTMSVAETASTFNETIVRDASLSAASDDRERLSILGTKLSDATIFLMNIRARFDFELAFFAHRRNGQLGVDELNELMLSAQMTAYKEGLATYHDLFWASKLHFYVTRAPFYNFPYTFGYLFSNGIYAQALAQGPAFRDRYTALLRDTGSMTTEELAERHLGVDLTRPDFWETAVDRVLSDVDEFVALVNGRI
jgi:pepF/M3 family oligoendopeptidase